MPLANVWTPRTFRELERNPSGSRPGVRACQNSTQRRHPGLRLPPPRSVSARPTAATPAACTWSPGTRTAAMWAPPNWSPATTSPPARQRPPETRAAGLRTRLDYSPEGARRIAPRRRRHEHIDAAAPDLERWAPRSSPGVMDRADAGALLGPRAADHHAARRRRRDPRRGPAAVSRPVSRSPRGTDKRDVAALRGDRRGYGGSGAAGAAPPGAGGRRPGGRGAVSQHAGGAATLAG